GYTPGQRNAAVQDLATRFQRIPGVVGVSYSENGIFSATDPQTTMSPEGFTPRAPDNSLVSYDVVGPHYAAAIGARLLQGRDIEPTDNAAASQSVLVNETMARVYFPGASAVGKWIKSDTTTMQIVGVIADVQDHDLRATPVRRYYAP